MEENTSVLVMEMKNISQTIMEILSKLHLNKPICVSGIFELFDKKEKEETMIEILKCIYENTPEFYDIFLSQTDTHLNTPLIKACIERKQEVVKYILNTWKMVPNQKNSDGLNAFIYCCRNKYEDEAMMILDKGETDILTIDPILHCTPIMYACSHRMRNLVRRILTMGPCNLGVPSKTGVTPIMVACLNGLFEECVVMYASGEANITHVCKQNNTLFNTTCNMGFEELAFKMINEYSIEELKAELVHKDGTNALHNALHHRMWGVSLMLIHKNYDLMIPLKNGDNPLIVASFKGLEDIAMEIAMRRPELITTKNDDFCTPLIMACDKKCVKLAHYLLDHGDCLISSEDNCNETALMIACKNELNTVALRILEISCESHTLVNTYQESALYWAVKKDLKDVYSKLFFLYSFHSSNTHDKKILELLLQTKNYEYQRIVLEKMTICYLQDKIDDAILPLIPQENPESISELKIEDFEEEEEVKVKKNKKNKKKKNSKKDSLSSIQNHPSTEPEKEEIVEPIEPVKVEIVEPIEPVKVEVVEPVKEEVVEPVKEEVIEPVKEEVVVTEPVKKEVVNLYSVPEEVSSAFQKRDKKKNKKIQPLPVVEEIIPTPKKEEVKLYVPPKHDPTKSRILNHDASPFKPRVNTPSPTKEIEVKIHHLPPLSPPQPKFKREKKTKSPPPQPILSTPIELPIIVKEIPKTIQQQNEELLKEAYHPVSTQKTEEMRVEYLKTTCKNRMNYTNIHYWYHEIFMKMYRHTIPQHLFNDIRYLQCKIQQFDHMSDWYKIEYFDGRDPLGLYVFQYIV